MEAVIHNHYGEGENDFSMSRSGFKAIEGDYDLMNKSATQLGRIPWFLAAPDGSLLKADVYENGMSRNRGLPILTGFINYEQAEIARTSSTPLPRPDVTKTDIYFNPKFNYGKPVGPFPTDLPYIHPAIPWKN